MTTTDIVRVNRMRSRYYTYHCAHCDSDIAPGAYTIVVIYRETGTVWYCLPCALALGVQP